MEVIVKVAVGVMAIYIGVAVVVDLKKRPRSSRILLFNLEQVWQCQKECLANKFTWD